MEGKWLFFFSFKWNKFVFTSQHYNCKILYYAQHLNYEHDILNF